MKTIEIRNKYIAFAIAFQFLVTGSRIILIQAIPSLYSMNNILLILNIASIIIVYLYTINKIKSIPSNNFYWIFIFVVLLTFIIAAINRPLIMPLVKSEMFNIIGYYILPSYMIASISDFKDLKIYMIRFSKILVIVSIIYAIFIYTIGHTTTSSWSTYNMSMSNVLLFALLWLVSSFFREKNIKLLVYILIGSFILLVYGTRSAILSLIIFTVFYLFFASFKSRKSILSIMSFLLLVIMLVSLMYYNEILVLLINLIEQLGLESRSIKLLSQGGNDISIQIRYNIQNQLLSYLQLNPFHALGPYGDTAYFGEAAHNMYLSILSTYGLFLGLVFITVYIISLIVAGIKSKHISNEVFLIMFFYAIPRSFYGVDIWYNDAFWLLLGVIFSIVVTNKYKTYLRLKI
ncbi:MAG: O-antigen ligase family protein [Acholeplasma sp.]|nr:O-antigen ligase family protein [Acholeplasma sp.]